MTVTARRVVRTEIREGVLLVALDHAPVNMGNSALRAELADVFAEAREDAELRAVVLHSALNDFYAGSDLKEFDGEIGTPELPEVISRMDALSIPIVAALRGHVLGGGLEVALAADARIAATDARIGFPETSLGMIPGAGGTVRASRLIGVPATIDLVATARRIPAEEALSLGLVDSIVETDDLLAAAIDRAQATPKRRLRDAPVPAFTEEDVHAVFAKVVTRRTRPNVVAAIDLIQRGAQVDGGTALQDERDLFTELRAGDESRALRHLFFARSAAAKGVRSHGVARAISVIGVAGAGTMGSNIAAIAARAGWAVRVFDTNSEVLERARKTFDEAGVHATFSGSIEALRDADLVIDAVFEDMQVKRELLHALSAVLRSDALIASNTSYLDLDELATAVPEPWRFAGLHFFNPADRNPLVEIVRCRTTATSTLATLGAVARRLKKTAIPARVADGFVANRIYADYRQQAEFLLEDGASPRQVDRAMESFGLSIGPFAVGDMSGLDIAWARRRRLAETRDPRARYVRIPDLICEAGRLGRKTGAGYYDYSDAAPRGAESAEVAAIIEAERTRASVAPRHVSSDEIVQRCLAAMVLAAADLVEHGIAERAGDIDLALVDGFAFPAWRGGPVHFASRQPREWLIEGLRAVHASDPVSFAAAAPAQDGVLPPAVARLFG